MWLLLAALTMLFGATLAAYVLIRVTGAQSPPLRSMHLPQALWLSTAIILLASYTIHRALASVRRERQNPLRHYLAITCILALAFVIVQTPSLATLLRQHHSIAGQSVHLYGLIFFLILVHALHVLGGIVGLSVTTLHAYQHRYDHEHYAGVKHAAMYWHFLDAVWIVMFVGMLALG
jgi:heme/copper-type cytochrome/quinol oxidase subunit 3